jgi:uracil-DNA glycosylase family 4
MESPRYGNDTLVVKTRRDMPTKLQLLERQIIRCERCPRLIAHCRSVAKVKRRAYQDWDYWGKPVPSFGDPEAWLLIVGLAPGAHGSNRTGRMFTGDGSGDFLYPVLHAAGFASQAESASRDDGMVLHGAYITAAVHCAPPGNKPSREEITACLPYLEREFDLLPNLRVVIALGRIAFDAYLEMLAGRGLISSRAGFKFAHNCLYSTGEGQPLLLSSYHPSQQNTLTGRLTERMFAGVFERAKEVRVENPVAGFTGLAVSG